MQNPPSGRRPVQTGSMTSTEPNMNIKTLTIYYLQCLSTRQLEHLFEKALPTYMDPEEVQRRLAAAPWDDEIRLKEERERNEEEIMNYVQDHIVEVVNSKIKEITNRKYELCKIYIELNPLS